jgi:hypothetical protein
MKCSENNEPVRCLPRLNRQLPDATPACRSKEMFMFRKAALALAAIVTVATIGLTATEASARGWGRHHGGYHGYHHRHFGPRVGIGLGLGLLGAAAAVAATPYCYNVVTRRGYVRTVCY